MIKTHKRIHALWYHKQLIGWITWHRQRNYWREILCCILRSSLSSGKDECMVHCGDSLSHTFHIVQLESGKRSSCHFLCWRWPETPHPSNWVGCHAGGVFVSSLSYADDMMYETLGRMSLKCASHIIVSTIQPQLYACQFVQDNLNVNLNECQTWDDELLLYGRVLISWNIDFSINGLSTIG